MKKIIIHIGMPKTGTTSLQRSLYKNKVNLKNMGIILYEGILDHENHYELAATCIKKEKLTNFNFLSQCCSYLNFEYEYSKLQKKIHDFINNSNFKTYVFTAESLSNLDSDFECKKLKNLFPNDCAFKIIFTKRNGKELLESLYLQRIKTGFQNQNISKTSFIKENKWRINYKKIINVYKKNFETMAIYEYNQNIVNSILKEISNGKLKRCDIENKNTIKRNGKIKVYIYQLIYSLMKKYPTLIRPIYRNLLACYRQMF